MSESNPYDAPTANVVDSFSDDEFQTIKMFSPSGRMGRVRYIAYSVGLMLLIGLAAAILAVIFGAAGAFETDGFPILGGIGIGIAAILYIAAMVISVFWGIQRLHDLNLSGWWIVLMFVPFINYLATPILTIVFWFVPGSKQANQFGAPPEPNTAGPIILAAAMPVLLVGAILAAIAIPAYHDYSERAAMQESGYQAPKN